MTLNEPRPSKKLSAVDEFAHKLAMEVLAGRIDKNCIKPVIDDALDRRKTVEGSFPWGKLPDGMKTIIYDWRDAFGLQPLYTFAAMLGAASGALGNRVRLQLTKQWQLNAALWIMSVGNPGTGKSSPIKSTYKPLFDFDAQLRKQYDDKYADYVANGQKGIPPKLRQVVLSDFTPESLWHIHGRNEVGVTVVVDELKGMLDSVNRYNQGALVSQLLTAYSGGAIKITRKGEELPTLINETCVTIFGTIQPSVLYQSITKDLVDNGFFDRWIVVWPDYTQCPKWNKNLFLTNGNDHTENAGAQDSQLGTTLDQWPGIIDRILKMGHCSAETKMIHLSREASNLFIDHHNKLTGSIKAGTGEDTDVADAMLENRIHKQGVTVGKLALTFEALDRSLSGFDYIESISPVAMECAIAVYDWLEERLVKLMEERPAQKNDKEKADRASDDLMQLLSLVPLDFKRADAIKAGMEILRLGRASIDKLLKHGKQIGLLTSGDYGTYHKTDKFIDQQFDYIA